MAVLHIVNRPAALDNCLGTAKVEDIVLLIEDGVYAGVSANVKRELHAIDVDIRARGIATRMNEHVRVVSYADFVQLAEEHTPAVTWR